MWKEARGKGAGVRGEEESKRGLGTEVAGQAAPFMLSQAYLTIARYL